ncbi:unnamed protein product, partial [Prorocentrum cordatum]
MQKPYHVASGRATRQPEPGQGRPPGRHRAGPGQLPGRPGTPRGGPEWTRHRSREPRRPLAGWPGGGWREGQVQRRRRRRRRRRGARARVSRRASGPGPGTPRSRGL